MKSRHIVASLLVTLLVTGASLAAAPLSERLPTGSLVYVGWAGQTPALDRSALGQALSGPTMAKISLAVRSIVAQQFSGDEAILAQNALTLAGIACRHRVALVLTDVSSGQGAPAIGAAAIIDLGADKEEFSRMLDELVKGLPPHIAFQERQEGDLKYRALATPVGGPLAFGFDGNLFFITLGTVAPQALLSIKPEASLASNATFAAAMSGVGGADGQAALYVDFASLMRSIEPLIPADRDDLGEPNAPPMFQRVLQALGVDRMQSIAGGLTFDGKAYLAKCRIASKAPHKGVLMLMAGESLSDADLASAPDDTELLVAVNLDVRAI